MEYLAAENLAAERLPGATFAARHRGALLGALAVVLFFTAWQMIFLIVPLNPLFFTTPAQIAAGFTGLVESGGLLHDFAGSAVPFGLGLLVAGVGGVPLGILMGWRGGGCSPPAPLVVVVYARPLGCPSRPLVV